MRISACLALFVLALSGIGCNQKPDAAKNPDSAAGTQSTGSTGNGAPPAEAPDPASIPAELKHEAFAYYGLANLKPVEFEITRKGVADKMYSTATTKFTGMKDGSAVFVSEKTGALATASEEVEVRKDGIYNTKIGDQPVQPPQLVVPAEMTVGKTWSTESTTTVDGKTTKVTVDYRIAGSESVKTPAGTFEALKVVGNGDISVDGAASKATFTAWFVKDVGSVKVQISTKGQNATDMTIVATKIG